MTQSSKEPGLNGLVALSKKDGVDIRPTLLRVMTDLYLSKPTHTEKEDADYARMVLKLLDHVDAKTRALIAGKIAGYPNAPAAVRQRLLKDHIVVQAPEEPAGAKEEAKESTKKSAKESSRQSTGKSAIEEAIHRPAAEAEPQAAKPAAAPLAKAKNKAAAGELSELFFTSDAEERRLILLNLPYAPVAPAEPLEAVAAQAAVQQLEAAALAHQAERFARDFARALQISPAQAQRLIQDPGGEPIVVAAAALGMPAAVLARILLCLNPAISRSVQRVYDLTLLHEELDAASALRLVAIWQATDREEKRPAASTPVAVPRAAEPAAEERTRAPMPAARPRILWETHALSRKAEG